MNKRIPIELLRQAHEYGMTENEILDICGSFSYETLVDSKNICFVMFLQDAISQNAILDILEKYNLKILLYRIISISEEDAEGVYESDLVSRRLYAWWIKRKIFNLGNTFVALVTCSDIPKEYKDIYDYLLCIKGASDPALSKKGTVRYEYRVSSKAFGFMHSSDDNISSLREALVFFSYDEIEKAVKNCLSDLYSYTPQKYDFRLKPENMQLNFYFLLYKIKNILLSNYAHLLSPELDMYLSRIYKGALCIIQRNLPFNEERKEISPLLMMEYTALDSFINEKLVRQLFWNRYDLTIICLFLKLSDERNFSKITDFLIDQLEYIGVNLDDSEKLLLRASLLFYA